uniref:Uncharacterized protein n=1 Tax=Chromera velia CCMP2878 TaxID=1169474 RepID=A0A0G4IAV1_9ALVE|eukprot:Cvel_12661.t1-p1 / transcript=Cvel_12661.t1 / gene=Cvel_12661 / organism=Chromera_velia_CCMP2878 / gene_product=hypothetical protein / transcript_product=hypothetical protein / location=Cvel_scaffold836:54871-56005(+) / protein_length=306 / sequence_SO=supercontig / SO=protein_coding / is_pseudo=false
MIFENRVTSGTVDKVLSERLEDMHVEVAEKLRTKPDYRRMRRISCMDDLVAEINCSSVTFGLYSPQPVRRYRRAMTVDAPTTTGPMPPPPQNSPKSLLSIAMKGNEADKDSDDDSDRHFDVSAGSILHGLGMGCEQESSGGSPTSPTSPTSRFPSVPLSPHRPPSPRHSKVGGGGGRCIETTMPPHLSAGSPVWSQSAGSPDISHSIGSPSASPSAPPSGIGSPSRIRASRFIWKGFATTVGSGPLPSLPLSPESPQVADACTQQEGGTGVGGQHREEEKMVSKGTVARRRSSILDELAGRRLSRG